MTTDTQVRQELLGASDETIDDAIGHADPMVLRGLVYQLTGDTEIAATKVAAMWHGISEIRGLVRDQEVALLRRKASEFLKAYRDAGAHEISIGPKERLPESLGLSVGKELDERAVGLWLQEFALDSTGRGLRWQVAPPSQRLAEFSVVVIGTGMGGLNAALELKRAGIPFTVFEKNAGVGGTWYENRYPGCRVDTPSRSYTHIFGVEFNYPYPFCPQEQNEAYFNWVADNFQLRDDIVFNTEVRSLVWDDDSSTWRVTVDGLEGYREVRANAVITAVGFLNRPNIPEIEGMAEFAGPSWHTARWQQAFDAKDKRIAVIGTGCTGYQVIPELALEAEHVTVFQRTPQWLFQAPGYRAPYPPQINWLDRNLPYHRNFMRFRAVHAVDAYTTVTTIDPEFEDPHARSAINKQIRDACIEFLEHKLEDPQLVAKMTPPHPPFSARPVQVDPEYSILDSLRADNVTLVTDGIRRINRSGIEDKSGRQHTADAIIYATGFQAAAYLFPMTVTGRQGTKLEDLWKDGGARAHRFSMIPGFPNLWMIYGPNTNGAVNVAQFHELVTHYALQCIEQLIVKDKKQIEPKKEAYWAFNELIDERNAQRMWSDSRAHNYYDQKELGRSAVMCPLSVPELWALLRHPDFTELEVR